ncbi:MAG: hypothetical protein RSB71_01715, partial [Bacilli bacterium]
MYETAIKVLKKINNNNYQAYIVGGYPRDLYLDRQSIDIDICTNATPKELKTIFKDSILPREEYGGVTIVLNNIRFEITTFRKEIKYENNRFPVKIKYINNLIDDLKRRDFTINTLCIDKSGQVIDLLLSKKDIDAKIIKTVGSAEDKIKTDILRSLRAIRFATILNFTLDDKLKQSIEKYAYLLKNLSYYRKKEELDKIFASSNAAYGLALIKELNLAEALELSNFDSLVITTSPLGMWAQLDVIDIYKFTNHESELILGIRKALKEDVLKNTILYKYGLYICTLVGEIKNIKRSLIVKNYNEL